MNPLAALKDYLESRRYVGEGHTLLSLDDRLANMKKLPPFPAGPSGGYGYGSGHPWLDLFSSSGGFRTKSDKINFGLEIGDLRLSSLIVAAIRWVGRNLNSARLNVVMTEDGEETEIQGHPITKLWHRPNKFYSGSTLNTGIAASWIMDATAYVLKVRGRLRGPTVELWWEPSWSIRPRWPQNGSEVVSYYEVYRSGVWYPMPVEDVIVFRDGYDPETRKGMNTIAGLLSEIYTDKQLAALTGMLVKNGLVPAIAIGLGDGKIPFKGDVTEVRDALLQKMQSGEPFIGSGAVKVAKLGYDLSDYGIKEMRETPEQRFCAGIGISPISLMLGAGINVSTYSNVEQYLRYDYRSYIVNLHDQMADQLEVDLLPDFGEEEGAEQIRWDYSKAPLMQPDKNIEWKLYFEGFKSRVLNRAQALRGIGEKPMPEDEEIFYPLSSGNLTIGAVDEPPANSPNLLGDEATDPANVDESPQKRVRVTELDLQDGVDFWKLNTPRPAHGLMGATIKPNGAAH